MPPGNTEKGRFQSPEPGTWHPDLKVPLWPDSRSPTPVPKIRTEILSTLLELARPLGDQTAAYFSRGHPAENPLQICENLESKQRNADLDQFFIQVSGGG